MQGNHLRDRIGKIPRPSLPRRNSALLYKNNIFVELFEAIFEENKMWRTRESLLKIPDRP
jgi:hypothetical protein